MYRVAVGVGVVVRVRSPSARIPVSYLTETCTTSDTSLPTWYRTTGLSCRGRLSGLRSPKNLQGGPGLLRRRVRRAWGVHLPRGVPAQPVEVVCRQDDRRL